MLVFGDSDTTGFGAAGSGSYLSFLDKHRLVDLAVRLEVRQRL